MTLRKMMGTAMGNGHTNGNVTMAEVMAWVWPRLAIFLIGSFPATLALAWRVSSETTKVRIAQADAQAQVAVLTQDVRELRAHMILRGSEIDHIIKTAEEMKRRVERLEDR